MSAPRQSAETPETPAPQFAPPGQLPYVDPPWPPPWARTFAFFFGIGLMTYETVVDKAAHLVVFGPAFLLTGLPLARGVELLLDKLPKKG